MTSGIYQIRNINDGSRYVGSTKNLKRRQRDHYSRLRNDKHPNVHLQNAFNKYGEHNFVFEVIERQVPPDKLIAREQRYLDQDPEYNICPKADELTMTPEIKQRIGDAQKGRTESKETRRKKSEALKGRKLSEEHKRRISRAKMGHAVSKETKRKISEAQRERQARIRKQKMKTIPEDYNEQIYNTRQHHSLTQKELSDMVGCSEAYIGQLVRRERVPSIKLWKRIESTIKDLKNSP